MNNVWKGKLDGKGQRHALLVSQWNAFLSKALEDGAYNALISLGVREDKIDSIHVPGCFELGALALKTAQSGKYDAVICLGCIIRGATAHFEHVASQTARLIAQASYDSGLPVLFGILSTDTIEQAIERSGTKAGNKGEEAAMSAVSMVNLYRSLQTFFV